MKNTQLNYNFKKVNLYLQIIFHSYIRSNLEYELYISF